MTSSTGSPAGPGSTRDVVRRLSLARAAVCAETQTVPAVGLVLGSGLGDFTGRIADAVTIDYPRIPGMPEVHVAGHAGQLVIGWVEDVPIACLAGRAHVYEGHSPDDAVFGVRLLSELGATTVLVTNAAGGINPSFASGALMLIRDHINLTGRNPLVGPNDERLGPRFPDMSEAYDAKVRAAAHEVAREQSLDLAEGVYAGVLGPSYETPAEVRMLATLGADAVGMSTVLEVIALRHRGVRVGGLSCVTNLAAGLSSAPLNHEEVQETAARTSEQISRLLEGWIRKVARLDRNDEAARDAG